MWQSQSGWVAVMRLLLRSSTLREEPSGSDSNELRRIAMTCSSVVPRFRLALSEAEGFRLFPRSACLS